VVRFDREWRSTPQSASRTALLRYIRDCLPSIDGIIVSDYGKGVITGELMDGLRELTAGGETLLVVDPKPQNLDLYRHVSLITPNNAEASLMSGIAIEDESSLVEAGELLLERLGCRALLITRGEAGMALFQKNRPMTTIYTVVSTITLALLAGLPPEDAAALANLAAGIVVGEVGTATVAASRLIETIENDL
jgi:D-glycero-beta-D-manno-heptose-7-phosphate kinase